MVLEILISLGQLLAPSDKSLADELTLASEKPAAYLEAHPETRERLTTSRDPASDPAVPWLALADGLIARNYAAELDWKEGGVDTEQLLSKLRSYSLLSAKEKQWLKSSASENMDLVDRLRKLAEQAADDGVVIATMDIDSDSYVVLILTRKDYQTATGLAAKLGLMLKDIREHDPNS